MCRALQARLAATEAERGVPRVKETSAGSRGECEGNDKATGVLNGPWSCCRCIADCLKFLKEIPSAATNDASANPFQHSSSVMNLYLETSSTLLKVLQAHSGQLISHQLSKELRRLQASSVHANSRLQNGRATDS
ncbi:uncharacterized protein LOC131238911 [Magnolia sinica]|uniref:uncharacterized protein LOC131238911 n=1 Tax=Magnolia sinica TaxID=86752 RepID=UPI0026585E81|nr:uncharacterized protein LOC131238911 [Magnolia sinica]